MVIRPRLYQSDPQCMQVPLDDILRPVGVRRKAAKVVAIVPRSKIIEAVAPDGQRLVLRYERLVLATGSHVRYPELPGREHLFDVDTIPAAMALQRHLTALPSRPLRRGRYTAIVVGCGFTGIEVATELAARMREVAGSAASTRVVIVEKEDVVGPELGPGPRPVIEGALAELGITTLRRTTLTALTPTTATLSDGSTLDAATVVWTAGMTASQLTAALSAPHDPLGRLEVDTYLRVASHPRIFAAGDVAAASDHDGHAVLQSCQHAVQQGKIAGHNVAADLLGDDPRPFRPLPYVTSLDLGAAGAVLTKGWHREVVATGTSAKAVKETINETIWPPTTRAAFFRQAADAVRADS